jgi:hypothetical protein
MPAKSEHEYRGWKVRITGNTVGTGSSAMIEVWEPGHDLIVIPVSSCHSAARSIETEALAVAFQTAKKWIDRQVIR